MVKRLGKIKNQINYIYEKLNSVDKKANLISAVSGINILIVVVLSLNLLISLIELLGAKSVESRSILFYIWFVLSALTFLYFVLVPLLRAFKLFYKPNWITLAGNVGKKFPEIKDNLVNAIQLSESSIKLGSKSLTEAAVNRVYEETKLINFKIVESFNKTKKHFTASALVIIASVLIFALIPGLRWASYRVINYDQSFVQPPKFKFLVEPGNTRVTKGEDVFIKISVLGEVPEIVTVSTKSVEETEYYDNELHPDSSGIFLLKLSSLKSSLKYFAHAEKTNSKVYNIEVIERPTISTFELSLTPPRYSRLTPIVQRDNGNIKALVGSRVKLKLSSSKYLDNAVVVYSDSTKKKMSINGKIAETTFVIKKEIDYKIELIDKENNANTTPIVYSVKTILDKYPIIEVIMPRQEVKLTKAEQIPIHLKINDDYGFEKLQLHHRLSASNFEAPHDTFSTNQISINKNTPSPEAYYIWDVSKLMLAAGDIVSFYFEVFDNDNVSGPKSTKTRLFKLRVPSMEELFNEADKSQESAELELMKKLEEAEKLSEEMKNISNELKKDEEEITWEEKKKIDEAAKKFEEIQSKVEEIQNDLLEMQNELRKNDLLSDETLEKYMELQKLLDELNSEDIKEAFKKLQQMLETMKRDQTQQAFQNMEFNEEMFKKSLERTVNLLKRIQIEQKMDELLKRTEELTKKMEEIQKELENKDLSEKDNSEELKKKQDEVSKQLERLNEEMKNLKEKMSEFKDMPTDQMEKLLEELEKMQNQKLSEEISEQLKDQMKMEAMENMQMLSQNMEQLNQQLQQLQQQMQMQSQMQTFYEMLKTVDNLLTLSREQESLRKNTEGTSPGSQEYQQSAQDQNDILRNLDKVLKQMSDLSQKTFAITPEMGRAMGEARAQMGQSLMAMQNRNSSLAIQSQNGAMKNLNEAANLMKSGLDQMMSGGEGGGMMSMMQQMQQLSQQQMNLNQLTQQLNQGKLSAQQRAQLQRLAEQQDMIRKSLGQLNKESQESGQSKKLAANLEKILKEMEEVITNLRSEKVNDDLVQSQEKILSKLLDAQRSINERDFEKQRESESGKTFTRESPPELDLTTEEGMDRLRNELMKAAREGYTRDYEELIRKYYEALEKEETTN